MKVSEKEFWEILRENAGLYSRTARAIEKQFNVSYSRQAVKERAEKDMERLNDILLQRLAMKGIAPSIIPRFIQDLTYTLAIDAQMNLGEINRRLHLLGWYDVEVDEHTLQLISATA